MTATLTIDGADHNEIVRDSVPATGEGSFAINAGKPQIVLEPLCNKDCGEAQNCGSVICVLDTSGKICVRLTLPTTPAACLADCICTFVP